MKKSESKSYKKDKKKSYSSKIKIIVIVVLIVLIAVGIHFLTSLSSDKTRSPPADELPKEEVFVPDEVTEPGTFDSENNDGSASPGPKIAEFTQVNNCRDLKLEDNDKIKIIYDFESEDEKLPYRIEGENSDLNANVEENGLCGKYLNVKYGFKKDSQGYVAAKVTFWSNLVDQGQTMDFSDYKYFNVVLKSDLPAPSLLVQLIERDNDWWRYTLDDDAYSFLSKDWFVLKIPMSQMHTMDDTSLKGDDKQDLSTLVGFEFRIENPLGDVISNELGIDQIFLSKK